MIGELMKKFMEGRKMTDEKNVAPEAQTGAPVDKAHADGQTVENPVAKTAPKGGEGASAVSKAAETETEHNEAPPAVAVQDGQAGKNPTREAALADDRDAPAIDETTETGTPHDEEPPVPLSAEHLQAALLPVLERLAILREIKNDVAYNKNKDDLIIKLDKQLQEYTRQKDQELAVLKPVFLDIVRVIDAIEDYLPHLQNQEKPLTNDQVVRFIDSLAIQLRDLLSDKGVEVYEVVDNDVFNPKRHIAVSTEPSDDPAKYSLVKEMKRPGYEHRNDETEKVTILRPAKVLAYKAPRPVSPASEPQEPAQP
jgi:molecular chaperone GrpE (heat shock protein)